MKNGIVVFLVLLIFSAGCSSFSHARYRKLNKVPASGITAVMQKPIQQQLARKTILPAVDTNSVATPTGMPGPNKAAVARTEKTSFPVKKTSTIHSPRRLQERKPFIKQLPPDRELGTVVVIFIFLFAAFLVFSGSALLIIGLYNGINWMIALGAAYLLLAVPPVWAFLRDLFGTKSKSDPKERKRR